MGAAKKYMFLLETYGDKFENWINQRFQDDLRGLLDFMASEQHAIKVMEEFETKQK